MADIVIRNAKGQPVVYNNIEETIYETPNGSTAVFVSTDNKFVKYSQQSLSDAEKQQARTNIAAQHLTTQNSDDIQLSIDSSEILKAEMIDHTIIKSEPTNLLELTLENNRIYYISNAKQIKFIIPEGICRCHICVNTSDLENVQQPIFTGELRYSGTRLDLFDANQTWEFNIDTLSYILGCCTGRSL